VHSVHGVDPPTWLSVLIGTFMTGGIKMMSDKIQLVFYDEKFKQELGKFELEKEQEKYTAYPNDALSTLDDKNRYFIVILSNDSLVGYFILHKNNGPIEIGSHERALLIRSLAINNSEQRKGYAFAAMNLLPQFVRNNFENITELVLVVNQANMPAQQLYKKVGFIDKGIRREGKIGIQYIYHYYLK